MKNSGKSAILALVAGLQIVTFGRAAAQEDSLFSSVHAATAFDNDLASDGQKSFSVSAKRLNSTDDLLHTLQEANFEVSAAGSQAVATTKLLASWQFPVLVTLSENEQDVTIVLGLRAVNDPQKVPAARLLSLLESNETSSRTSFAFNRERSRIELFSLIRNSGITAQVLRDEVNRLAILARDTESLWNLEDTAGGATGTAASTENSGATRVSSPTIVPPVAKTIEPPATSPAPSPTATLAVDMNSLQGRWSASRSATEAFAILLNADGTFVLASINAGKQARSTGKFTLQNSQLALEASDGTRLLGKITLVTASEFRFEQQTNGTTASAAITFHKAP